MLLSLSWSSDFNHARAEIGMDVAVIDLYDESKCWQGKATYDFDGELFQLRSDESSTPVPISDTIEEMAAGRPLGYDEVSTIFSALFNSHRRTYA